MKELFPMKIAHITCIVTCFLILQKIQSNQIITFFLRSFYEAFPTTDPHTLAHRIQRPGKLGLHHIEQVTHYQLIKGTVATYAGYVDVSDDNGQILFPLKHASPQIHLLITPEITPVIMFKQTIHHWERNPSVPASLYTIEKKESADGSFFWHTSLEALPNDLTIPLETIIILTEPEHLVITHEPIKTDNGPNMVLPDIYIKKGAHAIHHALYLITIAHLLSPISPLYKEHPLFYEQRIH